MHTITFSTSAVVGIAAKWMAHSISKGTASKRSPSLIHISLARFFVLHTPRRHPLYLAASSLSYQVFIVDVCLKLRVASYQWRESVQSPDMTAAANWSSTCPGNPASSIRVQSTQYVPTTIHKESHNTPWPYDSAGQLTIDLFCSPIWYRNFPICFYWQILCRKKK